MISTGLLVCSLEHTEVVTSCLWIKGTISLVLENLFGNAWKSSDKKGHTRIEFGIARKNGDNTFFVRDNGFGFSMEYAKDIFKAFKRLETTEKIEGTGIGLASVQRVIEKHAGRICAESAQGEGSTFYFVL